jgi:hypothetical protein
MFDGLAMMNAGELAEITRLIGVEKPPSSRDVLHDIVSGWLARAVKKEGKSRPEIERAVLEWTSVSFKIPFDDGVDTNDLERSIRRRIADDAAAYLSPSWTIICALVAVGKSDNIARKLTLLEQAASMAVPSQTRLHALRGEWEKLCAHWSQTEPMPELQDPISEVAGRSQLGVECLTLGLALSLLDGGISFPTERLFRDVATEFGLDRGQADALQKKVNNLYWKHHNAAQPTQERAGGYADPVGAATRQTVYEAGALEALATDARMCLFSSMEPEPKKSGWSRLMGSLSGMSPFFSDRMKDGAQATLARVVYHTIVKQHVAIAAEKTEKADIAAEEQARAARIAAIPPPAPKPNPFIPPTSVSAAPAMPSPTPSAAPEWDDFPQVEPPPAPLAEKVEQPTTKRIIKLGP